jgi:hypothetical protein
MQYKEIFEVSLASRCQVHLNELVRQSGPTFLQNISRLVYLLVCLRNVPDTEEHRDERAACLSDLLKFYEFLNREAMYIQYVHKLVAVHVSTNSFLEAAYALSLHALRLHWSDGPCENAVVMSPPAVAETQRELKIVLFQQIIDYFDRGQAWELAIQYCNELVFQVAVLFLCDFHSIFDSMKQRRLITGSLATCSVSKSLSTTISLWGHAKSRNTTELVISDRAFLTIFATQNLCIVR